MSAVLVSIIEEPQIAGMSEGRLEWHFRNWSLWMRKDAVTDGAPNKAAGCIGGGYSRTFDEMADASEVRCAMIVDSLVNSLSPVERAAVYHKYLYAVFRFRNTTFDAAVQRARRQVAEWLVARGVY